jgi:hypothetical protein
VDQADVGFVLAGYGDAGVVEREGVVGEEFADADGGFGVADGD